MVENGQLIFNRIRWMMMMMMMIMMMMMMIMMMMMMTKYSILISLSYLKIFEF